MDSVKHSSIAQNKSKLSCAFSKVLHFQFVLGAKQKSKSHEKVKNESLENAKFKCFDDADKKLRLMAVEAFLAKLFASISTVKTAYAQLQFSQSPYDPDGVCSADKIVVSELKNLSELKQRYLKKQIDIDESSPKNTLLLAEIQEQNCTLKTYEIMGKKLKSQLKLKNSEIASLREKLVEINKQNKILEKRLNSSTHISVPNNNLGFSELSIGFFVKIFLETVESIQTFTRLLCREMESARWDLDASARSIQPGVAFWKMNHRCYAFESFVCSVMFDAFNYQNFSISSEQKGNHERKFFDRFLELKYEKPADYLAQKPNSNFARFCHKKYSRLIHPWMEQSPMDQRAILEYGKWLETPFITSYFEMAKHVWLLHCLAFSFNPETSIFQVSRETRFSEVYMEAVNEEAFALSDGSAETEPRVAFSVVPGFRIGKTVVQCQVYLF